MTSSITRFKRLTPGINLACSTIMSERDRLHRDCRVWLYMLAVLHLACLALVHQPVALRPPADSLYARRPVVDSPARLPAALPRL